MSRAVPEERRRRIALALTGRKRGPYKPSSPKVEAARRDRISKSMTGRKCTTLGRAADEYHCQAKRWYLLSPANVIYECVNLNHFVRTHTELFDPADVEWKPASKDRPNHTGSRWCRAEKGIRRTSRAGDFWKEWRAARDPEILHVIQAQRLNGEFLL